MNGEWQEYTQEFTDEETGIHITVKYDIPDHPLIIGVMPDGYVLTDKGNEALKHLLAQAGFPKGVPARLCYLGECTHAQIREWQQDYEQLVQVAEMYVDAFGEDEMLTLLEAMRLTAVRDAIARWRKKQEPVKSEEAL